MLKLCIEFILVVVDPGASLVVSVGEDAELEELADAFSRFCVKLVNCLILANTQLFIVRISE